MDPERARELVAAERARIEQQLAELGRGGIDREEEFDTGDQAADLYQEELDESRERDLHEQLRAVERAERRLADGTYGLSVESGARIPDERLEALPLAELTVEEEAART